MTTTVAQTNPPSIVVAKCVDCSKIFEGELGIRFIVTPEGPGVEVMLAVGNFAHTIARFHKNHVPTVRFHESKGHA